MTWNTDAICDSCRPGVAAPLFAAAVDLSVAAGLPVPTRPRAEVDAEHVAELLDAGDELSEAVAELIDTGAYYSDRVVRAARTFAYVWERGRR